MRSAIGGWMLTGVLAAGSAGASDVEIVHARFARDAAGRWSVEVTLRHDDTGWDHYADGWRLVDADGALLGMRTLYHPHVDEQPFTRGLYRLAIPPGTHQVAIEARDNVDGWSPGRLRVDLDRAAGEGYEVSR